MLNYNTAELCVRHIDRLVPAMDGGLCLIDNGRSERDLEVLSKHMQTAGGIVLTSPLADDAAQRLRAAVDNGSRIVLLPIGKNLGFGAGNNTALKLLHDVCGAPVQALTAA